MLGLSTSQGNPCGRRLRRPESLYARVPHAHRSHARSIPSHLRVVTGAAAPLRLLEIPRCGDVIAMPRLRCSAAVTETEISSARSASPPSAALPTSSTPTPPLIEHDSPPGSFVT